MRISKTTANKVMSLPEAIRQFVHDGDSVALEGFTHLIPFAAAHEIIRQRITGLTACRLTPDLIYDQLIAAGCVRKLVFSWAGNPGAGSLHSFRRAIENRSVPAIEIEEYSHFGMIMRLMAGASHLTFMPLRSYHDSQLPNVNDRIRTIVCPYTGEEYYTVPALNPDVAVIHAQRSDAHGNTQAWGLLGVQKETAFASKRVIVTVEEIVSSDAIRADPNRTVIPGLIVDAVVLEPFGAHPSYTQGYYDRDNAFYGEWEDISRDPLKLERYLNEMVYSVSNRTEYVNRLGVNRVARLRTAQVPPIGVQY
jgi:glutaconate CoA-transferase, subunit A